MTSQKYLNTTRLNDINVRLDWIIMNCRPNSKSEDGRGCMQGACGDMVERLSVFEHMYQPIVKK